MGLEIVAGETEDVMKPLLSTLGLLVLLAGCGCRAESTLATDQGESAEPAIAAPQGQSSDDQQPPEQSPEDPPEVSPEDAGDEPGDSNRQPEDAGIRQEMAPYHRNTGDSAVWPSYDLPLEFTYELPEVPPQIVGPFPEVPEAAEETK